MSDYNVQVKVRNNNILKALSEAGYSPGYKFCEECGISMFEIEEGENDASGECPHGGYHPMCCPQCRAEKQSSTKGDR